MSLLHLLLLHLLNSKSSNTSYSTFFNSVSRRVHGEVSWKFMETIIRFTSSDIIRWKDVIFAETRYGYKSEILEVEAFIRSTYFNSNFILEFTLLSKKAQILLTIIIFYYATQKHSIVTAFCSAQFHLINRWNIFICLFITTGTIIYSTPKEQKIVSFHLWFNRWYYASCAIRMVHRSSVSPLPDYNYLLLLSFTRSRFKSMSRFSTHSIPYNVGNHMSLRRGCVLLFTFRWRN